jgi:hypothetical protein
MRRTRVIVGLCVAVCALAATAVPAMAAKEFTASSTKGGFPLKFKGEDEAEMKFGNGLVFEDCSGKAKGTVPVSPAKSLKVNATFKECEAIFKIFGHEADVEEIKFKAEFLFKNNGVVVTGEEGTEVEIGAGSIKIPIKHTDCSVVWPAQTLPAKALVKPEKEFSAGVYETVETPTTNLKRFPSGFQKTLDITAAFGKLQYEFVGGVCAEFEGELEGNGVFEGGFELEVPSGNIAFEEVGV